MELFDSHCHLNDEKFEEDREKIIAKLGHSGVKEIICAGYNIPSSKKAIQIANGYSQIHAICGISPNDISINVNNLKKEIDEIRQLARNEKIVAIGEIGLDYYWNKENKEIQRQYFISQIDLANQMNLPIVIHTREAIYDTLEILKTNPAIHKGVFHCCPFNPELIKEGLKLGFYISFAGPITFKNSKNAEEVIRLVPDDKILIETDSPYLSPEPNRGKRNDPTNIFYIAEKIASVKGYCVEKIAQKTYENTCKLFKIER